MKRGKSMPAAVDLGPGCRDAIRTLEETGNLRSTAANNVLPSVAMNGVVTLATDRLIHRTGKRQDEAWFAPSTFMMVLP
ncbi:hypothetical protein V8G57_15545 [Collimonas sp. H4R21]|uniref:Uncharacterized protein n=1 Tax=Collimonas rhizosphaerae TaxID=3126357 RepID=A0ABU9PY00_9BURK